MPIYNTSQGNQSLYLSNAAVIDFAPISNLGNNVSRNTVQDIVCPGADVKIIRVCAAFTTGGTAAITFNIVYGGGNITATGNPVGTVDTAAVSGTCVFAAGQTIAAASANNGLIQTFYPDVWDTIYQTNNPSIPITGTGLTLRVNTNGTGAITGILKVSMLVQIMGSHAARTGLPTPAGNYTDFDPSVF